MQRLYSVEENDPESWAGEDLEAGSQGLLKVVVTIFVCRDKKTAKAFSRDR
jgi:hypothetical protein